jgi:CBS domain-containing protein
METPIDPKGGDMMVQQIMTKTPKCCSPGMNVAETTALLWSAGCGALPVVNAERRVVGIVTDRDICIALGTRNRRPSELTVGEVMSNNVAVCHPDDEIHNVLNTMRTRKVRRLPVVSRDGKLEGMLCASDILLRARHDDGSRPELSFENIVSTLCGIYWHCPPANAQPQHTRR